VKILYKFVLSLEFTILFYVSSLGICNNDISAFVSSFYNSKTVGDGYMSFGGGEEINIILCVSVI
jgi:hypothetical protein